MNSPASDPTNAANGGAGTSFTAAASAQAKLVSAGRGGTSAFRSPLSADPRVLPALYQLGLLATRGVEPGDALREMLELFVATFHADAGSIALLNPDTGRLETEVQIGIEIPRDQAGLKLGHGITGWCVLNRRALLVPDVALEPRYIAVRPSARSEMAAPMLDDDTVVGVVDLESDQLNGFSAEDLAALDALAREAARVMQRLWQLQHRRKRPPSSSR